MAKSKNDRLVIDKVFVLLGSIVMLVMFAMGYLAWYGSSFVSKQVKDELSSQKIYFPAKGSPALDPAVYPDLQQYAGQLVDSGDKAKAYANGYIGRHIEEVAGGKSYAEISSEAMKNKSDTKLQAQKATLFQGETLRGLLLNAYAFGTIGKLVKIAAYVFFAGSAIMALLVIVGYRRIA